MFEASADNDKIKQVYGNFGFWAWLKYWYIDSANQVQMMLIDKGYYDYDFEKVEKEVKWEQTILSQEELSSKLSLFGIGKKKNEPMTLEEIQAHVIKQMEEQ